MNFPDEAGGLILWLQVALGFVGLLVMVERMIFFQHARSKVADLLIGVTNHVRQKAFAEALHAADKKSALDKMFSESPRFDVESQDSEQANAIFREKMTLYLGDFDECLSNLTLGQIALTEFDFPSL